MVHFQKRQLKNAIFVRAELQTNKQAMSKNFGLTLLDFNQMLLELQRGEEKLLEEVFLGHFQSCINYLKNNCQANHEDAYDITMDTLLDFRRRLLAGKVEYGNLRFLFTQMAVQKYLKTIKTEKKKPTIVELQSKESSTFTEDEFLLLDKSLSKMGAACRSLLRNFYEEGISLKSIAEGLSKTPSAIRKQKERCVNKLRQLFLQHTKF